MLVLSRKPGEEIIISDEIVVRVLDIGKGRVRIGFTAPESCRIMRAEIVDHEPAASGSTDSEELAAKRDSSRQRTSAVLSG